MQNIIDFFNDNMVAKILLDSYFVLILMSLVVFIVVKCKKALPLFIIGILIFAIDFLGKKLGLDITKNVYSVLSTSYVVIVTIILAPDLRRIFDNKKKSENKDLIISSTEATKEAIVDSVFNMSYNKVGALITVEQHNSLDQYAERAIQLNSDISRELLEQIFIKDSPLHDGGVIIRGNKIVCAGAYFVLTQDDTLDKTVGSRHRAAVGISEITDSLTIVVSEETGSVHVANAGFMKVMTNKNELLEYLNLFLGR